MFNKKTIIIVLIVTHYSVSYVSAGIILRKIKTYGIKINQLATNPTVTPKPQKPNSRGPALVTIKYDQELSGRYEEQQINWAPKMTNDQIEYAKKFYKKMLDEQRKAEKGIPLPYKAHGMKITKLSEIKNANEKDLLKIDDEKPDSKIDTIKSSVLNIAGIDTKDVLLDEKEESENKAKEQSQRRKRAISNFRQAPSGGTVFLDQICHTFFPIGDPYSGAPDGPMAMAKWCVELFIKGALAIIYSVLRWPHKILSKMMVLVAAIGFIPNTLFWCLNPISISQFISKSIIVNKNFDDLAAIQYRLKVRTANIVDKVHGLREMQEQGCCAFLAFKLDLIAAVDEVGKDFINHWMNAFFKLHQIIYCGEYVDGTGACDKVQFDESDPMRVIPRGPIPLWMELFAKYF